MTQNAVSSKSFAVDVIRNLDRNQSPSCALVRLRRAQYFSGGRNRLWSWVPVAAWFPVRVWAASFARIFPRIPERQRSYERKRYVGKTIYLCVRCPGSVAFFN